MNSLNNNSLYIIVNYALNHNIYKLISSIEKFCFSFLSLSLQNNFQLYLIYNNSYSLLFPSKVKDLTYLTTSNYNEISKSISDALKNFFDNVADAELKLNPNDSKNNPIAINVVLKKILLEINQKKNSNQSVGEGNFLISSNDNEKNDRIILINDSQNDFDDIKQKYVFLLKKEKTKIDILSINEENKNKISKALCLFTNGFFDNTTKIKNNIEQILIQEYMPIERKEILQKSNGNIKNSINYIKAISDDDLTCSICHKPYKNKEERNDLNINNLNNSFSQINLNRTSDGINRQNQNHNPSSPSPSHNSQLYYSESIKNVICHSCFSKNK